jgi:hypothetical protein
VKKLGILPDLEPDVVDGICSMGAASQRRGLSGIHALLSDHLPRSGHFHGWAEEQIRLDRLPPQSGAILEAVLYRGELPRGDAAGIVGTGERQARRVVSGLTEYGVLVSESSRAPLRLAFPAVLASRWMPGLFPEKGV